MKKKLLLLAFSLLVYAGYSQPIELFYGNSMKFSLNGNNANDTLKYPFIGGIVAPQFSEIDMNGDGIKDMMVFDRSGNKVLCFLNEGKPGQVSYKYAPQYEDLFPPFYNWVLLRDYNCDGKEDIFTNTEANGYAIYMNTTTNGNLSFKHIVTDLLDDSSVNMYCLSLDIPVIDDLDGDGDLDILAFGVLGGSAEYYQNRRVEQGYHCDSLSFGFVDYCWGSFAEGGFNSDIFLEADCGLHFYRKNAAHSGSTLLTLDADGDGDKELILGDIDASSLNFLKNGKTEHSWPWDTIVSVTHNYPPSFPTAITRFVAAYYVDVNNDGKKDLITASNDAVAGSNVDQVWWYKNNGQTNHPNFQFIDSSLLQDLTLDLGSGTSPVFFDTDGDGDKDLLIVNKGNWKISQNNSDRIAHFENTGTATAPKFVLRNDDYMGLAAENATGIYLSFGDLNNDSKPDMMMGRQNGKIRYYTNTGTLSQPAFTLTDSVFGGIDVGSFSTPSLYDVDGDNALDLLIGNSFGTIKYFRNQGTPSSPMFNSSADIDTVGHVVTNNFFYSPVFDSVFNIVDSTRTFEYEGYSNVTVADLDQDGTPEMITGGRNGFVRIFEMKLTAMSDSFVEHTTYLREPKTGRKHLYDVGARSSSAALDLDGDGRPEIVTGNSRGGLVLLSSQYQLLDSIVNGTTKILPHMQTVVYPNPANESFELSISGYVYGNLELEFIDILGRTHWTSGLNMDLEKRKTVNTSNLPVGVYFLQLTSDNFQPQTIKIMVVR